MSHFKAKMHQVRFRQRFRPLLDELIAIRQTPQLDLIGPTSQGKEWRKGNVGR